MGVFEDFDRVSARLNPNCSAGFPACGFTGLSSPVVRFWGWWTADCKPNVRQRVTRTRRQCCLLPNPNRVSPSPSPDRGLSQSAARHKPKPAQGVSTRIGLAERSGYSQYEFQRDSAPKGKSANNHQPQRDCGPSVFISHPEFPKGITASWLLNHCQKRRGRTSARQRAPGLQNFLANRRICRPGAHTGRFLQQVSYGFRAEVARSSLVGWMLSIPSGLQI